MAQDNSLLDQINTPANGLNGVDNSQAATVTTGGTGGSGTETLSSDIFSDPAAFALSPAANGGAGGDGSQGQAGIGDTYEDVLSDGVTTRTYSNGSDGETSGDGGAGGDGTLAADDFTVGSVGTPNAGFSIDASATGGVGATGDAGGNGGSSNPGPTPAGGSLVTIGQPEATNGGSGGSGGSGGNAGASVAGLTDNSTSGVTVTVAGTAGLGGSGGTGGDGGLFSSRTTNGGRGGAGAGGGLGAATLSTTSLTDATTIGVSVEASGGNGGGGGADGAFGGPTLTPGDGGAEAGDGGAASASMAGDSFSAPAISIAEAAMAGAGGNGAAYGPVFLTSGGAGAGGSATASMTGGTFTGSTLSVSVAASAGIGGRAGSGAGPGVGGAASADVTGNSLTGAAVAISVTASPGAAGYPLTGPSTGPSGAGSITFSNNMISATASGLPGIPNSVALGLGIDVVTVQNPEFSGPRTPIVTPIVLNGASGGNLTFTNNSIEGDGASLLDLDVTDGVVSVDAQKDTISIADSPTNMLSGFTRFEPGTGGPYIFTLGSGGETVMLTPGHGDVTISLSSARDFTLDFDGYQAGFGLAQINADTAQHSSETVINVPGDGTVTMQFGITLTASNVIESNSVPCFRAGTWIATPTGEVAVESLRDGDAVICANGASRPVVWIGQRQMDCAHHPEPRRVWPIRIAACAFGPGQPRRALWLSPDHAVFVFDRLIPIKHLVNTTTITQVPVNDVTYYHVELACHELLLAEGLPAESYLDSGDRTDFANSGTTVRLFSDFSEIAPGVASRWETMGCAPLVISGPALDAVRRRMDPQVASMAN